MMTTSVRLLLTLVLGTAFAGAQSVPGDPAFDVASVKFVATEGHAYSIQEVLIAGGPAWLDSEVYDISARIEALSTPAELKLMLRKVHEETREMAYYALVHGKNSPKLDQARLQDRPSFDSRTGTLHFTDLASVARRMSVVVHRPVFDLTGAAGSITIHPENVFTPGKSVNALREDYFESLKGAIESETGLKIEARKGPLTVVVIDSADRPAH